MPFVPSRDGLCLSFIGHVNVCPFSLSRSPRCSRFVFLALASRRIFSLLSYGRRVVFSFRFSIPWFSYIFRGRRQLPQAGEVRRPPDVAGVWLLFGSGGLCLRLVCSTFYSVLGQGLGGEPDHLGGSGGHSPIMVRFRCFLSCVAVAAAFGWQGQ